MTSCLNIVGSPVASFEVLGLPSQNTFYNYHFRTKAKVTKEFRELAKSIGTDIIGWSDTPLIKRAMVLVKVHVPHEGIMDIHNVHIKPIMDGLSDAGVWADDEWTFIPVVLYLWSGVGAELLEAKGKKKKRRIRARRTIFELYELGSVELNGSMQNLPKGRTRK